MIEDNPIAVVIADGVHYPLNGEGPWVIGRRVTTADQQLADILVSETEDERNFISRRHAVITKVGDWALKIHNAGSNGTAIQFRYDYSRTKLRDLGSASHSWEKVPAEPGMDIVADSIIGIGYTEFGERKNTVYREIEIFVHPLVVNMAHRLVFISPDSPFIGFISGRMSDYASKISVDDITGWINRFVSTKSGWRYQIRRSWKVREIPVSESTIFHYEWKIYPSQEQIGDWGWSTDIWSFNGPSGEDEIAVPLPDGDGLYYVFKLVEDGFILEHSNVQLSGNPYWMAKTSTVIPFGGHWNWGQIAGIEEDPHDIVKYLDYLCSKFKCNHYSVT